jgi:hypothetical protein
MVQKLGPVEQSLIIKFGGGLHTRASEDEIDPREAADGNNFLLDLENRELKNRPPFDLIGQVPNAAEIRGGASLRKSDGTVSTLIQAGATVYKWNGGTSFTPVGTVSSTAKLRGHHRSHNWLLDNLVIITDLSLVEVVQIWDGTTFQAAAFTNQAGASFGTFYAKYCNVSNERAIYYHVRDPSTTTPHMIVGSERGNYDKITVANRAASSLSEGDPFFLLTPDLKPINGAVEAFGTSVISTEAGELFNLSGTSAKDFAFNHFYPGSGAAGEEAVTYIGNDIVYGRQGRIESVRDTDRFGDTEADDLTKGIADQVADYAGWRLVFNARLNRVYCFPDDVSEVWVYNVAMRDGELSPWMRWTTTHSLSFEPTFVMSLIDPSDGLEYVIMGDASGNVYRTEGTGASGDGGQDSIATDWQTKLHSLPLDMQANSLEGYLKYRKGAAAVTVALKFEWTGETAFDETVTLTLPAISGGAYFGGDYYFGGDVFFGVPFLDRILRQKFDVPGQAPEFQVRVTVESVSNFRINEMGLRWKGAS